MGTCGSQNDVVHFEPSINSKGHVKLQALGIRRPRGTIRRGPCCRLFIAGHPQSLGATQVNVSNVSLRFKVRGTAEGKMLGAKVTMVTHFMLL